MIKKLYAITILVFVAGQLFSQTLSRTDDTLKTKDVVIIKEFEPTIITPSKINNVPKLMETVDIETKELIYPLLSTQYPTYFEVSPIKPAVMKGEPLEKLYKAYLKGGYGLYNTALGEFYINNLRSRTKNYGFQTNHLSSSGTKKLAGHNGYSNTNATLYGKQIYFNKSLLGSAGYEHKRHHLYGFGFDTLTDAFIDRVLNKDIIKLDYNKYNADVQFKSYFKDSNLVNYDLNLSFYELTDSYGQKEDNINLDATFDRFYNSEQVFLDLGIDYNKLKTTVYTHQNTLVDLAPSFSKGTDKWRVKLSMKVSSNIDSVTTFFFYPIAFAKYNMISNYLIPYVGLEGGLTRNNYDNLRNKNPFLQQDVTIAVSNKKYEFYGGLRGEFSSISSFNVRASQTKIENYPLFINDFSEPIASKFEVVYDTLEITNVTAEISFQKDNKFNVLARGDFYLYQVNKEAEAWHLPSFKATLTGFYDLQDKLVFKSDIYYITGRVAKTFDAAQGEPVGYGAYSKNLKDLIDFNLGIEYRYNKNISGWLNLNNLASIKYNQWNNYPNHGFLFMVGFSYSFLGQ